MSDVLVSLVLSFLLVLCLFILKDLFILSVLFFVIAVAWIFYARNMSWGRLFKQTKHKITSLTGSENFVRINFLLVAFFILSSFIGATASAIVTYFILSFLLNLKAEFGFIISLILISFCALLFVLKFSEETTQFANLTYYFLCSSVLWQVFSLDKEEKIPKKSDDLFFVKRENYRQAR